MSFQGYFWPYLRPGAENVQNELPGATFGCVCGQGLKMLKISFMGLLLAICAAICWKCSKWASWGICAAKSWKCIKWASRITFGHMSGFARSICHMDGEYKQSSHVDVWLSDISPWIVALIAGTQKAPWALKLSSRIQGLEINVLYCWNLANIFSLFNPSCWYSSPASAKPSCEDSLVYTGSHGPESHPLDERWTSGGKGRCLQGAVIVVITDNRPRYISHLQLLDGFLLREIPRCADT